MTQQEIQSALAAPFPADAVGWKAQAVTKDQSKALAVAYIDARCVIDRLNAVVGLAGWQDAYDLLPDGCVVCHLSLRIDGGWVTKVDVGGESDQPNGGDKRKAAFSDALKRAAVKFGVGRYLYELPGVWCDYDPKRKQLSRTPGLPEWALPRRAAEAAEQGKPHGDAPDRPAPVNGRHLPADGKELLVRLNKHEQQLVGEGRCKAGDLVRFVLEAGRKAGHPADLHQWTGPAMQLAVEEAKRFGEAHPA